MIVKVSDFESPTYGVKGRQLGRTWDGVLLKGDIAVLRRAHGYSPGVADA